MLADERRCAAFRAAIDRVVQPGDVIFDVGAGTGLLSYFASAKARAVYAVEADAAVAELGQRLIALNGLANLYTQQGRYEEAEPLYQQALRIREQSLEPEHSKTADILHAFAGFRQAQGQTREAAFMYPPIFGDP